MIFDASFYDGFQPFSYVVTILGLLLILYPLYLPLSRTKIVECLTMKMMAVKPEPPKEKYVDIKKELAPKSEEEVKLNEQKQAKEESKANPNGNSAKSPDVGQETLLKALVKNHSSSEWYDRSLLKPLHSNCSFYLKFTEKKHKEAEKKEPGMVLSIDIFKTMNNYESKRRAFLNDYSSSNPITSIDEKLGSHGETNGKGFANN